MKSRTSHLALRVPTRRTGSLLLTLPLIVFSGISHAAEPDVQPASYNQFTAADEDRIGAVLVRDFEAKEDIISNVLLDKYLAGIMDRLGKASRRPEVLYNCKVINSKEVNAFSFPGGAVYVTTALLDYVEDESELASVLGHEIGHIAAHHLMNRISLDVKSKALLDKARALLPLLDGKDLEAGLQKLNIPLVAIASKTYDRSNETDADLLAVYNLVRAHWDPLGEVRALDRLQRPAANGALLAPMLASHPNPGDRSRAVSAEIRTMALSSSLDDNSLSFRAMKAGLGLLPKPGKSNR